MIPCLGRLLPINDANNDLLPIPRHLLTSVPPVLPELHALLETAQSTNTSTTQLTLPNSPSRNQIELQPIATMVKELKSQLTQTLPFAGKKILIIKSSPQVGRILA